MLSDKFGRIVIHNGFGVASKKEAHKFTKGERAIMNSIGIQAQLTNYPGAPLADGAVIPIDKVVRKIGRQICLKNGSIGTFILCEPGMYLANWNVSVAGTESQPFVRIGFAVDGVVSGSGTAGAGVGEVTGSDIVNITKPTEVALVNYSGETIQLCNITPIVGITIVRISNEQGRTNKCQFSCN